MSFTYEKGWKGQEIRRLQAHLGEIDIDGDFGPMTEQALMDYQASSGLVTDGRCGPLTRESLGIQIYHGVDVSKWNKIDDWSKMKSSGLADFCWIKLTEGGDFLCSNFSKHKKNAQKAGIPCGSYHFARPDLNTDPHKEVENFVKNCPIEPGQLRPVLDFEKAGSHSPDSIRSWVLTFLQEFERRAGVRPVIYTGGNMTKYHLMGDTSGIDDYALWHAYYPSSKAVKNGIKPDRLGNWKEWLIWQWTGTGTVPGAIGDIDRNWLVGGQSAFDKIFVK